ncbi:hypothetical protein Tsubulata_043135, partial [Turnera subulata]
LRKSPKSCRSHHTNEHQNPEEEEEEKQGLLHHQDVSQMAQSSDSHDRKEEVVVKIDDSDNVCGKATRNASLSPAENLRSLSTGSSSKSKVAFEQVLHEAVHQRSKDLSSGQDRDRPSFASFRQNSWRSVVHKAKSRLMDPPEEQYRRPTSFDGADTTEGDREEEDGIEDVPDEYRKTQFSKLTILQWLSLVALLGSLVCILSIPAIKRQTLWDLPLWKWDILLLALICGRRHNFLLRKRVLYFVCGLRRPVQNCLWLGLVLLVWHFLLNDKIEGETESKILPYGTRILVCFLIGALIWLLKTLLVKIVASSFHVNTFFDRIQEALFNQYVIETLSGPPLFERNSTIEAAATSEAQQLNNSVSTTSAPGDLKSPLLAKIGSKMESRKLQKCSTVGRRPKLCRAQTNRKDEEIPVDHLQKLNRKNVSAWNMRRMINIVSHGALSTLDEQILGSDIKDDTSLHIRSECQAKEAAKKIFHKVAKPGNACIFLDDIMRFLDKEEAWRTISLFGAACENDGITKTALNNWLMVVEEMNILTTVFLRYDNQKIIYPNSVLATKPIANFYRSPDMGECYDRITIDFAIHISTPMDKIAIMKDKIKGFVEGNNHHWHPGAMVVVKDVEDMNRINMSLWVTHRMNHQDMGETWARRTVLVEELINAFREPDIQFRMLPIDVNVRNMPPLASDRFPSNWTTCG